MICHLRWFREMDRWIPGGRSEMVFAHPMVPLDDILVPRQEKVVVSGELGEWQPITIHFDGSVDPRRRTTAFKGSMFAAFPGDLVFSKIDVRNGAITVIPESFPKVVVTSEYPVHTPDSEQVDADYLRLLLRTPEFLHHIKQASSGTSGRKRITPERFREFEVPLPDPADQKRLVAVYGKAMAKARKLEAEADEIEKRAVREFEAALGLTPPPNLPHRPFQVARFKDIERWSHEGILQSSFVKAGTSISGAEFVQLGDIAEIVHGCSAGPSNRTSPLEVLKISAVTRGVLRLSEKKFISDRSEFRQRFNIRAGDILLCRTNGTLRYVGMAAFVSEDVPNMIFPDKVIRVRLTDESFEPLFLCRLLQLPSFRIQIEAAARTAVGNFAIGSSDLAALEIPIIDKQHQLDCLREMERRKTSALQKRDCAASGRRNAWQDFINAIFS